MKRLLFIWVFASLAVGAEHDEKKERPENEPVPHPTSVCGNVYEIKEKGQLSEVATTFQPNRVYLAYDSVAGSPPGQIVFIAADEKGQIDRRPIGIGSVIPCDRLSEHFVPETKTNSNSAEFSNQCELIQDGRWVKLRKDKYGREKPTVVLRLSPRLKAGAKGERELVWDISREEKTAPTQQPKPADRLAPNPASNAKGTTPQVAQQAIPSPTTNSSDPSERPPTGVQTDADGKKFEWVNVNGTYVKQLEGYQVKEYPAGSGKFFNAPANYEIAQIENDTPKVVPPGKKLVKMLQPDGTWYAGLVDGPSVAGGYERPAQTQRPASNAVVQRGPVRQSIPIASTPVRSSCPPGARG